MRLLNKVALITGAASGIGRAGAVLFASEGAHVVVADLVMDSGQETAQRIREQGGHALFVRTDLCAVEDVRRLVERSIALLGRIDILYNNAGINLNATVTDTSEEDW
jgi:NAD(P)-dependent dehydrogenase (short-subunit alcohol dehydrogenase family)